MKPKDKAEEFLNTVNHSKEIAVLLVSAITQENYKHNNNNRFDYWMEVVKEIKQYKD